MYAPYFGLKGEPFSIAPDPHFLYMSERHREALAHLLYGLGGGGGFVLLTGEIGTGKTTVCRLFLEQIPENCNVAYIFNPKLTVTELLQSVCDEFHIDVAQGPQATAKGYVDALNAFLLCEHAAGRNNVLIIDEAQNLAPDVLEQLRLLTNLETRERKLLQIVLIGQPELRGMLAQPQLEQLAQRVIARYHLGALTPDETARYVQHRLEVAGLDRPLPFERRALKRVHDVSRGVPRRINLLCDRALLGAFANSQAAVDRSTVDKAAAEVFDDAQQAPKRQRAATVLALGLVAGAGLYAAATHVARDGEPAPRVTHTPAVTAPAAGKAVKVTQPAAAGVAATASDAARPSASLSTPPTLLHDPAQAWRELAQLWKVPVEPGDPCSSLAAKGLHCFSRNLSLATIRELGRPGIVKLDAATGSPSFALLTALGPGSATISANGTQQTVSLAALASRWQGDFATLWKAPPGYLSNAPHAAPETVAWMADGLAASAGNAHLKGKQAVDSELRAQIKSFQLAQGLNADGQPGPMTYMQLNRAAGIDEPRLRSEP